MKPADLPGWLRVLPQTIAPQHTLSRWMHRLSHSERPWLARWLIRNLLAHYPIDLADALEPDPTRYRSLNDFFTRALRPGTRPMPPDPHALASPADGVLSQYGELAGERAVQAKGRWYSVTDLLALSAADAAPYHGGHFATVYLAPHNYHRVHAPADCTIEEVVYVPGDLFSVNRATAAVVPDLFARNERVILHCRSEHGALAIVLVGAMLVGSMTIACCDLSDGCARRAVTRVRLAPGVQVTRGTEVGRFNMGSTVVLVFARDTVRWTDGLADTAVRVGQPLGHWRTAAR